jgi:molecular chaperone DnaK
VEPGSTIAVYDFGGGTFDAAVVHKDGNSFSLLGRPEGVDRLGGIDFDEIVFEHVVAGLPEAFEGLDENDPAVLSAIAAIRRECVEAKEALSSDTEVSIPVLTPAAQGSVRMHRSEFEAAIRPQVEETVDALQRAVSSAGLSPPQLSAVLLVGGSSRIPLVGQLVSEQLGRPVTVDVDPKNAISMGAVLSLQPAPTSTGAMPPRVPTPRAGGSARFPIAAGAPPLGGGPPQGPYGPPAATGGYGPGPLGGGASSNLPPHRPAPPRPPVAPPPRPAAAYAPEYDDEPPYEPQYDYAPEPRGKTPSWLVTAGAVAAAVAVVAAVFLWPQPDVEPTANRPAPATPVEATTEPAPTTSDEPAPEEPPRARPAPPPPPRATTQPPVTTTTPPPVTTTTTPPPVTTTTTTTTQDEQPPGDNDPPGEEQPGEDPQGIEDQGTAPGP